MRVALIRKEYADGHGGAERYAVSLAQGLASRGHSVCVLAGTCQASLPPGIAWQRVSFAQRPSALKNFCFQRAVRDLLAGARFDIVNGLSQVFPQDIYRAGDGLHRHWLAVQSRHPALRILMRLSLRHQVILHIEREIFRTGNYRRIIVNSLLCKSQVQSYYGVRGRDMCLVYNGVDVQRFSRDRRSALRGPARAQLGLGPDETALLFAGHNFRRKGLRFALHCALGLRAQGFKVKLLVAGRGNPRPFAQAADRCGFRDHLLFLGPVADMQRLFSAADILLHPALYDPFSNVCLEAMACGVPVVTTRQNGAAEVICPGMDGLVVEAAWHVEQMVAGVAGLLENNGAGLQAMSAQAAQTALQYPMARNIDETLAVYDAVLSEKGGGR